MKRLLLPLLLFLFLAVPVFAQVDLVSPATQFITNNTTQEFEYYNGVTNAISCDLTLGGQVLPDTTVQEGFNTFVVQGLTPGNYTWSIACENTTTTQTSGTRTFILDTEEPDVQLTKPDGVADELTVRFYPTDDVASTLVCELFNNNSLIETATVQTDVWYEESFSVDQGNYELVVSCRDEAGNTKEITRAYSVEIEDFLVLSMNKAVYSLGEDVLLTIDAPDDAIITVDICPNAQGFVECLSPIIDDEFPQTVALPYNQSGDFFVEGIMSTSRGTTINSTSYVVENTLGLNLDITGERLVGSELTLTAETFNTFGSVQYTWELHNGSTFTTTTNTFTVVPKVAEVHTDIVTIEDAAGNQKTESLSYTIENGREVIVYVKDQAGRAVSGATVQFGDVIRTTDSAGKTDLVLTIGQNKLYAGKAGYAYVYITKAIQEETTSITLVLTKDTSLAITMDTPANGATFTDTEQIPVKFTVNGAANAICVFYMGAQGEDFLEAKSTVNVTKDGQQGFGISDVGAGTYSYSIECTQNDDSVATVRRTFSVAGTAVEQLTAPPDKEKIFFEDAIESLKNLDREEKELMEVLGFENDLRQAKKRVSQLARDIYDVRYRDDLQEGEKEAERARLRAELDAFMERTPISVEIVDSRTVVEYITQEEIEALLTEHEKEIGVPLAAAKTLAQAQQKYTMKTTVYRALVKESDGEQKEISVVSKSLTYGTQNAREGDASDRLIEIIPKTVVRSAKDIKIVTAESEILVDDPVLSFPAGERIVYYVEKDVSLSDLEETRTMLLPKISVQNNGITGFSIAGSGTLSKFANTMGIPLYVLVALLITGYLVYYFGLIDQAKYVLYQSGPKKQTHYMRVLMNDIHDLLRVGNYDKALLIYKELKLTYDTLPIPAKNELYDEITYTCAEIDKSYLKNLVEKMTTALHEDKLQDAIAYYGKIEGTYHRLPLEEQKSVQEMVVNLGKRLGMSA